jgi:hypothetical protein
MDKQNITAEWARKQATTILGEKINQEINICLNAIEQAVVKNQMSTSVGIYVHDLTLEDLRKRGFTVKKYDGDQRDGSYTSISW